MICRTWRGYATHENAEAYEHVVRATVIPGIESREIRGFLSIDLLRRQHEDGVEFMTITWFESEDAIAEFVG